MTNERTLLNQLPPITGVASNDISWISHYVSPGIYQDRYITQVNLITSLLATTGLLTASRALVSTAGGGIGVSTVTSTELGYVSGVTSAIQTQLNAKQNSLTLTTTGSTGAATLTGATLNIPQYSSSGSPGGSTGQVQYNNSGSFGGLSNGQLPATATNDSAASGKVGEYISSQLPIGTPISLTTGTVADVTSISLTAGDWDVTGVVDFAHNTPADQPTFLVGTSTTSATKGPQDTYISTSGPYPSASFSDFNYIVPTVRYSLSTTTTIYLISKATFAAGSMDTWGTIRARRMR